MATDGPALRHAVVAQIAKGNTNRRFGLEDVTPNTNLKEVQQAEMVIAPSIKTEGKVFQFASN